MSRTPRLPLLAMLLVAVLIPTLYLGAGSKAAAGGSKGLETCAEILSVIEERHAPAAEDKRVIYNGIHGMLHTLDPHTNFLDDDAYKEMREEQRGSFYGLGIVISKRGRFQPLRVVAPIADTPAARLGIRAGDTITHIKDKSANVDIDTIGLTVNEAVKYLRGPRNTEVEVTIDRPGLDQTLAFSVVRDAVRTPAINQAFMVNSDTGFIQIANFIETTSAELDRAIESLRQQGCKKLILSLQGNPGGLLEEAIGVASRFLDPQELVVYTEGRLPGSRQDYPSLKEVTRVDWPLVVLIDRGSASASEIVSGALQDHDRAVVIGETSFGKGLVQSVYPLSENTALALTTQKYYTPSGRSIQRPYDDEDDYYIEWTQREDVPAPSQSAPKFATDLARPVFGGGGITPDIPVKIPRPSETVAQIARVSGFSRFVTPLKDEQRARYASDKQALFNDFLAFSAKQNPSVKTEEIQKVAAEVTLQLEAELAYAQGVAAHDRVLLMQNPLLKAALDAFPSVEKLMAQRRAAPARKAPPVRAQAEGATGGVRP